MSVFLCVCLSHLYVPLPPMSRIVVIIVLLDRHVCEVYVRVVHVVRVVRVLSIAEASEAVGVSVGGNREGITEGVKQRRTKEERKLLVLGWQG